MLLQCKFCYESEAHETHAIQSHPPSGCVCEMLLWGKQMIKKNFFIDTRLAVSKHHVEKKIRTQLC